jgi:major membrane immunogen (membrane-anchored lipoprotein)
LSYYKPGKDELEKTTMKRTNNFISHTNNCKWFIVPALFALSFFLLFNSCVTNCNEDGSLDELKAFKPSEKYFKAGFKGLHFVLETSPIEEVDKTFQQLIKAYDLPITTDSVADGNYTGESPYDAFDYKHVVKLTIKAGEITEVVYNEMHKNGSDKKSDKKYNEEMSVSGTSPAIAYPEMEKQLLEKQEMWKVDATTGATYSLYRFRYAVTLALMKAELANRH